MAEPRRNAFIGIGSRRTEGLPPSQYTQQRDADKDARQVVLDADNKKHREQMEALAKKTREHAEAALDLQKLNAEIRQKEIDWKLKEAMLATGQAMKLMTELGKLDATDPDNYAKRLAIEQKYPGARLNKSGNDFLESWDSRYNAAAKSLNDIATKQKAHNVMLNDAHILAHGQNLDGTPSTTLSTGQKVVPFGLNVESATVTDSGLHPSYKSTKPEPKLTPAHIDGMRRDLDTNVARYESARAGLADALSAAKPDPITVTTMRSNIAFANSQIRNIGKRLQNSDVTLAPEIKSEVDAHLQRSLTDEHGDLETQLTKEPDAQKRLPIAKRLNAVKGELNQTLPAKQQYRMIPDGKAPAPRTTATPSAPPPLPKPVAPVVASPSTIQTAPVASSSSDWNDGQTASSLPPLPPVAPVAAPTVDESATQKLSPVPEDIATAARAAIAAGKDEAKVRERLLENGYDHSTL